MLNPRVARIASALRCPSSHAKLYRPRDINRATMFTESIGRGNIAFSSEGVKFQGGRRSGNFLDQLRSLHSENLESATRADVNTEITTQTHYLKRENNNLKPTLTTNSVVSTRSMAKPHLAVDESLEKVKVTVDESFNRLEIRLTKAVDESSDRLTKAVDESFGRLGKAVDESFGRLGTAVDELRREMRRALIEILLMAVAFGGVMGALILKTEQLGTISRPTG